MGVVKDSRFFKELWILECINIVYVMLCYVMLCYVMLCYVMRLDSLTHTRLPRLDYYNSMLMTTLYVIAQLITISRLLRSLLS